MPAEVLAGCRVIAPVTARESGLADDLAALGATVTRVEFIAIEPPADPGLLGSAVTTAAAGGFAWTVFTSRNAVRGVVEACAHAGIEFARACAGGVAVAGEAAALACRSRGVEPALLAPGGSEALVEMMPPGDAAVLAPLGNLAPDTVVSGLAAKGWSVVAVEAYRTVRGPGLAPAARDELAGGAVDAVLLTSASVAESFADASPTIGPGTIVAGIGSQTATAARGKGVRVDVVAESPSRESLMAALVAAWQERTAQR